MSNDILVRVGLPSPGGALTDAARALGSPVLVSANSFFRRNEWKEIESWRTAPPTLDGLDASLDSAGFVAMALYKETIPVDLYVAKIVKALPWTWWSSIDLCCEPEVAPDPIEILFRQAETARLYGECCKYAKEFALPPPLPVLQGFTAADYSRCVELFSFQYEHTCPPLIGVGSVCRRHLHGHSGILAVVRALSDVLPEHARFHLFGIKHDTMGLIMADPSLAWRIHSIDSMAWDLRARKRYPTGRTADRRAGIMREWYEEQMQQLADAREHTQNTMSLWAQRDPLTWGETGDESLDQWLTLVASNEIEMRSAFCHYWYEGRYSAEPEGIRLLREEPGRPITAPDHQVDPGRIPEPHQLALFDEALEAN